MKLTRMFMGLLGALALTGCSSEEIVPDQKPIEGEGQNRYMSITVRSVLPGTRATATKPGDQETVDGGDYEIGYGSENTIKTLRFYFFDDNGDPIAMNYEKSYYDCTNDQINNAGTPDMDQTVEKILNAIIVIHSNDDDIANKIKKMAAIANFPGNSELNANLSVTKLKEIVGNSATIIDAASTNGFAMTSSNYLVKGATDPSFTADIKRINVQTEESLARANPVEVYVERIAAKVRVKAAWDETVYPTGDIKNVTYKGKPYQAIPLYKKPKAGTTTKEHITASVDGAEKDIYVIFTGWNLWWTADKSYLFKNIDGCSDDNLGDWWNSSTFKRSFWAINPSNVALQNHVHKYANKTVLTTGSFDTSDANNIAAQNAYCLENAADDATTTYLKRTYDPSKEKTNRTLVYLAGVLVTLNDAGTEANELELAEWAATREPISNMKKRMFEVVQNQIYFRSKDGETVESSTTTEEGILIENNTKYKIDIKHS